MIATRSLHRHAGVVGMNGAGHRWHRNVNVAPTELTNAVNVKLVSEIAGLVFSRVSAQIVNTVQPVIVYPQRCEGRQGSGAQHTAVGSVPRHRIVG